MGQKVIELLDPIIGHSGPIKTVVMREPKAADFFELGDPIAFARSGDMVYSADKEAVIKAYVDRCVVEPNALLLEQLSLADAMRVRDAVVDFFSDARVKTLPQPATSSSSGSGSQTPPGAAS
jgi:hypothetical protein